jgi:hypothetical protein
MTDHTRSWPSREEWAKGHRTYYADDAGDDALELSDQLTDYASPQEIADAIQEAKALWSDMGRRLKHEPPGSWLRFERRELNRQTIKPLIEGRMPYVPNTAREQLPRVTELCQRHDAAVNQAYEAKVAEYAARPIDDAAWERELRYRERIERYLAGDRFHRRPCCGDL